MNARDLRPTLCADPDVAPPDADVLLQIGAVTVAAHASVLMERSKYFAALFAWPAALDGPAPSAATAVDATAVNATAVDATAVDATAVDATAVDATAVDATAVDATAVDATAVDATTVDAMAVDATTVDATAVDVTAVNATAVDATAVDAAAVVANAAPRTVRLHDTLHPDAALLALRALYGLPWSARWDEMVDAHELLDGWAASPDVCDAFLDRLASSPPGDRAVYSDSGRDALLTLAWGVDGRALSEPMRRTLLRVAARHPTPFRCDAWERVGGPAAAQFLAHPDLRVPEEVVLRAALRWARAAPRPDDELSAVSRSVRYGALDGYSLLALWTEPDVPPVMLRAVGRLMTYSVCEHLTGPSVCLTRESIMRYLPRVSGPTAPSVTLCDIVRHWRFWSAGCPVAEHRRCCMLLMPSPCAVVECLRATGMRHAATLRLAECAEIKIVFETDGADFVAKLTVSQVKRELTLSIDNVCEPWRRDLGPGRECSAATLFRVADVARHVCHDTCALRADSSYPVMAINIIYPSGAKDATRA